MNAQSDLIRKRLKEMHYSSYWLAKEIGRSKSFMNSVTRGDKMLTAHDTIVQVATALQISPDDLYIAAGRIPPDIVDAIVRYPQFIPVIRANREKLDVTHRPAHIGRRSARSTVNDTDLNK